MHSEATPSPLTLDWDLFCRVVDNFGDIGVCWRLARRLARLGQRVRLWTDDAAALGWMAPQGAEGVTVLSWHEPAPAQAPGDVVVEAFGCDPPAGFVERMAAARRAPVWINLEYLSAEPYVERSHGLRSPQLAGPGRGLDKWFFYPGFTRGTGGLLHEDGLELERARFDAAGWLAGLGIAALPGARRVSLFCYEQPALAAWLAHWRQTPTQLLVTRGPAAAQVAAALACSGEPGTTAVRDALAVQFLPWLPQTEFDRLLWACDLNLVRGEDSLARAVWAARPFLWQLYPQHDRAHAAKLDAFLAFQLAGAEAGLAGRLRAHFAHWNGLGAAPACLDPPADRQPWRGLAETGCHRLEGRMSREGDLAVRLCVFVAAKRRATLE